MKAAAALLACALVFLVGVLLGVGSDDKPRAPAPVVIHLGTEAFSAPAPDGEAAPQPGGLVAPSPTAVAGARIRQPAPSPAPPVEQVEREVEYGDIEDYGEKDEEEEEDHSGPGGGSSGSSTPSPSP